MPDIRSVVNKLLKVVFTCEDYYYKQNTLVS